MSDDKKIDLQDPQTTDDEVKATPEEEHAAPSLSDIIREQVAEEDTPLTKNNFSLRKVLGGDILTTEIVRKQIWLLLLITVFLIVYIAEGYSYKQYMIEIDRLNTQLKDAKFKALSAKSDLTEHTRESKIIDMLKINNDSTLHNSGQPPYIINVPEQ